MRPQIASAVSWSRRARDGVRVLAFTWGVALVGGCHTPPTLAECDKAIERYVYLTLGPIPAGLMPEQVHLWVDARIAQKRLETVWETRVAQCQRQLSRRALDCAIKAETPGGWESCVQ